MITVEQVGAYLIGIGKVLVQTGEASQAFDLSDESRQAVLKTMMENGVDGAVAEEVIDRCIDGLDFNQRDLGVGVPYPVDHDEDDWSEDDEAFED